LRPDFRALGDCFGIVLRTRRSAKISENFSFHLPVPPIQDAPEEFINPVGRKVLLISAIAVLIIQSVSADLFRTPDLLSPEKQRGFDSAVRLRPRTRRSL
jgi:hypothetical protein